MARRLEDAQYALPEPDLVAFADSYVRKRGAGPRADVDLCTGACRQFVVPGKEMGMQVRFKHVRDAQAVLARFIDIKLDVALRVDDRGHSLGANHVRSVRQTTQIELFEIHTGLR